MDEKERDSLLARLAKRGFHQEGVPLVCPKCEVKLLLVLQTKQATIGGRDRPYHAPPGHAT